MKIVVTTLILSLLLHVNLALAQEDVETLLEIPYVVADVVFDEFACPSNTNVLTEENILRALASHKTEELLDDVITYSEVFERWSKIPVAELPRKDIATNALSSSQIRAEHIAYFNQAWHKGTEPIARRGSILTIAMIELASRREANAKPYLSRIAETQLPKELGVPRCARVKRLYQNPAADAWLILTMPQGLSEGEKTDWLTDFIGRERELGKKGKRWAIEAAERMLRRIECERKDPAS
jgi:hypothetical protein